MRFPVLCCMLALLASSAFAAPVDPRITSVISELEQTRVLRQVALSPDGQTIAWVLDSEKGGEIQVAAMATPDRTRRLTAGSGASCNEESLAWSPDSKQLAFTSDCAGSRDVYITEPGKASAAPRRLTHLHGGVTSLAFSPDGSKIGCLYIEGATRPAGARAAMKPPSGVIGVEGVEIQRVATIEAATGDFRQVSPMTLHVYEYDWSPNSRSLAYVAATPPGENNWWVAKLYIQSLGDPAPRSILDQSSSLGLQIAVPRWSPDSQQIAFIGGLMSDQGATGGDIYIVPVAGGAAKDVTPGSEQSAVWIHWLRPSALLVSSIKAGETQIGELDPESGMMSSYSTLAAYIGDGRLEESMSLGGGKVAYIESSFAGAPEVYSGTLGGPAHAITHYNDGQKPMWGKPASLTWKSDRFTVQGWLLYPAHYDPRKKYPLIVSVHGGPSAALLPHWPDLGYNPITFSALDYFVLMPNPRGSFGEGEDFTLANRKDFGHGDLRDILAGIDAVTAQFPIDPKRIGLTGWSYGGFMTMFAVTQTNRFRSAVAGAGIANWQSYYGENSIDQWMTPFFGASVYEDPAVYARSSAIHFIHNVKTPTLMVVGDRDGECPAPQSFEFWHALREEQVPTELVVYPEEGHIFHFPEHRRDVLQRALLWFEQYMPPSS